jgi:hypothetical protein
LSISSLVLARPRLGGIFFEKAAGGRSRPTHDDAENMGLAGNVENYRKDQNVARFKSVGLRKR